MQALADHLQQMLGPGAGIGLSDPRDPAIGLLAGEDAALGRAVPARRASFAAGRRAARAAMAQLGLSPAAIPQGPQGAPKWPPGLVGSIAHCDSACIAVVTRATGQETLGVDIEAATALDPDLIPIICTAKDMLWVNAQPDPGLAAKQVFCAKEAIYKAQFPLTGQVIGFDAVRLTWTGTTFATHDLRGLPAMGGEARIVNGFILTTCQPQKVPA